MEDMSGSLAGCMAQPALHSGLRLGAGHWEVRVWIDPWSLSSGKVVLDTGYSEGEWKNWQKHAESLVPVRKSGSSFQEFQSK
jgi:hypothetical protein